VQSARAIRQAARRALEARFSNDWCRRAPYSSLEPCFLGAVERLSDWPEPSAYDGLAALVPQAPLAAEQRLPRFVAQDRAALQRLGGYEPHVARERAVPTRERSWHDFFNMAIWAHFPRLRWALNALHVDGTLGPIDPRNGRAPQQNVAAQFDESGVIVASTSRQLLTDLRELKFKRVFWDARAELLQTTRFWVIGHGMLESLLAPHPALSGKALLIELPRAPDAYAADELRRELDASVAERIYGWRDGAPLLDPLPLLGVPGYSSNNGSPEFYDNERYFRFQRRTRD
jgi:DUF3025 family protein